jgi:hypothetical protein
LSYYRVCRVKGEDSPLVKTLQNYKPPVAQNSRHLPVFTDFQDGMARVLSGLPLVGFNGVHAVDLAKLLPPDPMEPALNIMASVRAYFHG